MSRYVLSRDTLHRIESAVELVERMLRPRVNAASMNMRQRGGSGSAVALPAPQFIGQVWSGVSDGAGGWSFPMMIPMEP